MKALFLSKSRSAQAGFEQGLVLSEQGRLQEAVVKIKSALSSDPGFAAGHLILGNTLALQGKYPEAISEFLETLRLVPDFPTCHEHLGAILAETGQYDKAISVLKEAVRINPYEALTYHTLAGCWASLNQFDEALYNYCMAAELNPYDADIDSNIGWCFAELKQYEPSLKSYLRAISKDPKHKYTLSALPFLIDKLNLRIDNRLNPNDAEKYYNNGCNLAKAGNHESAVPDLQMAAMSNAFNPNYYEALSRSLVALDRYEEAAVILRKALQVAPGFQYYELLLHMARQKIPWYKRWKY